jgi:hypothetical protein
MKTVCRGGVLAIVVVCAAGAQGPSSRDLIAFRVDDTHVVATFKILDSNERQVKEGLSAEPVARYGYRLFDPPAAWLDQVPADLRDANRWTVHAGAGKRFGAVPEKIVGGQPQCSSAVGVLLRVDPGQSSEFAALRSRYFAVQPGTAAAVSESVASVPRMFDATELTLVQRAAVESTLGELLRRELAGVQKGSAADIARMASSDVSYHRSWARERQAIDAALSRGRQARVRR